MYEFKDNLDLASLGERVINVSGVQMDIDGSHIYHKIEIKYDSDRLYYIEFSVSFLPTQKTIIYSDTYGFESGTANFIFYTDTPLPLDVYDWFIANTNYLGSYA